MEGNCGKKCPQTKTKQRNGRDFRLPAFCLRKRTVIARQKQRNHISDNQRQINAKSRYVTEHRPTAIFTRDVPGRNHGKSQRKNRPSPPKPEFRNVEQPPANKESTKFYITLLFFANKSQDRTNALARSVHDATQTQRLRRRKGHARHYIPRNAHRNIIYANCNPDASLLTYLFTGMMMNPVTPTHPTDAHGQLTWQAKRRLRMRQTRQNVTRMLATPCSLFMTRQQPRTTRKPSPQPATNHRKYCIHDQK